MNYPIKVIPNARPLFYFKKRKLIYYNSILESSDMNVHEQVVNIVNTMYPDRAIRILDIACGGGALALRLKDTRTDMGFADEIVCVDIEELKADIPVTFYQIDLNDERQVKNLINLYPEYFDLILGIETIEHLENPKLYLSNLKKMLYDDGHIFISTPNINTPFARRIFYKKGRLEQFSEQDLEYGHVSVILPHILYKISKDLQLQIMAEYPLGLYPKFWLYPNIRSLYITLCNILKPRLKGSWAKLYIFKKE